ncbi:hypothetical protein GCM10010193_64550 [Kitasatospora atroaurantiaca]
MNVITLPHCRTTTGSELQDRRSAAIGPEQRHPPRSCHSTPPPTEKIRPHDAGAPPGGGAPEPVEEMRQLWTNTATVRPGTVKVPVAASKPDCLTTWSAPSACT